MTEHKTRTSQREHRYVRDRLSAYVDSELESADRARLERHLALCAECRTDLHTLRWTKRLLQQAPPVKVPRSFVVREADVAARRPTGRRIALWRTQWATAAIALLFVLVLGSDLLTRGGMRLGQWVAAPGVAVEEAESTVALVGAAEQAPAEVSVTVVVEQELPVQAEEEGVRTMVMPTPEPPTAEKEAAPVAEVERSGPADAVTPTAAAEMMLAVPEGGTVMTTTPEAKMMVAVPEGVTTTPDLDKADTQPERTPPGDAVLATAIPVEDLPTMTPEGPRIGLLSGGTVRLTWLVAEIVLGTALVGLTIAIVWMRRRG